MCDGVISAESYAISAESYVVSRVVSVISTMLHGMINTAFYGNISALF
jgi:hypothetical protein